MVKWIFFGNMQDVKPKPSIFPELLEEAKAPTSTAGANMF